MVDMYPFHSHEIAIWVVVQVSYELFPRTSDQFQRTARFGATYSVDELPNCAARLLFHSVHHVVRIPKPVTFISLLGELSVFERVSVCVHPYDMVFQVIALCKRLVARLADKRLLPRMCPHVFSQATGRRERLAARLAGVRLLPRVCLHVPGQNAGRRERRAARLADIRLLPRMCPHVISQGRGNFECLGTTLICTVIFFGRRWHDAIVLSYD